VADVFLGSPEARLMPALATDLGAPGINGADYPATLPLMVVVSRIAEQQRPLGVIVGGAYADQAREPVAALAAARTTALARCALGKAASPAVFVAAVLLGARWRLAEINPALGALAGIGDELRFSSRAVVAGLLLPTRIVGGIGRAIAAVGGATVGSADRRAREDAAAYVDVALPAFRRTCAAVACFLRALPQVAIGARTLLIDAVVVRVAALSGIATTGRSPWVAPGDVELSSSSRFGFVMAGRER
jgi:hypothetical protein